MELLGVSVAYSLDPYRIALFLEMFSRVLDASMFLVEHRVNHYDLKVRGGHEGRCFYVKFFLCLDKHFVSEI